MRSLLITLTFSLLVLALPRLEAGNPTVTSTADSGPGSLRDLIDNATDGATIQFAPSLNGQTISLTSGELLIGANITIDGLGASQLTVMRSTAGGTAAFRVFHISPGHTVTIQGLTISNGLADGDAPAQSGGGIYNDGSILTIVDSNVTQNSAGSIGFAGNGGGIFSSAANTGSAALTITGSLVSGNNATGNGGGVYNDAAGDSNVASLVLNQSAISVNSAQNGAGILNNGSMSGNADLLITDCTINGNIAAHHGGGLLNFGQQDSGNTRAILSNSTVSGNSAENGGGIMNDGQSGNGRLDVSNTTISGNSASQHGGGVYNTIGAAPRANRPTGGGAAAFFTLRNTILNAGGMGENIYNDQGQVTSDGYNLSSDAGGGFLNGTGDQVNTNPLLGPLQQNGGPTMTHALPANSAAVNGGDPSFSPPPFFDQRGAGFDRVFEGRIDIGAYELQETAPTPAPGKLINISTRLRILTADNALIGGFIVTGSAPRTVLLRAIGPSLTQFGVPDAIADPVLELHGPSGFITLINNNWRDNQEAQIEATGIAPTNDLESAILAALPPGAYTAIVHGVSDGIGVGLVEAYDLDSTGDTRLANISTRGFVDTGNDVMIGGFILGHGVLNAQVLIRAIGPSLAQFGVPDALADPTLELHNGNGALIAMNDNWRDTQEAEIAATGIPPTNDFESAILQALSPGAYTAVVSGKNNTTGVGLVEAYQLNPPPTPVPTPTPSPTPGGSPTPSPTPQETPTPTPEETPTPVPTITPTPTATPEKIPVTFSAYSTTASVGTDDAISMNAIIVNGPGTRRVIVRGLGPSLPGPGVLADPALELRRQSDPININDNWRDTQEAEIKATGFAPAFDLEAAIVQVLDASSFTVVLRGVANQTGVGANDLHDLSGDKTAYIGALGTRGQVTGTTVLGSGIQVELGGDILIRVLGPSLASAGIAMTLADPTLELRDSNGAIVVDNDNWQDDPKQEPLIIATGLAPSDPLESAVFVSLLPGTYTTIVQGVNDTTGIGYVQFYSLPHIAGPLPLTP